MRRLRRRDEHGLTRVAAPLMPGRGCAPVEVELHQAVDEVAGHLVARPVDVAVAPPRQPPVGEAREFEGGLRQPLTGDVLPRADPEAGEFPRGSDRLARAEAVEVELVDDRRVGGGHDVHDHVVPLLERVDVVEGEERRRPRRPDRPPALLLHDVEPDPAVRLPAVIANERLAAEQQPQRVDHQREFRHDQVALGHAERVHVRGPFGGDRRHRRLPARLPVDAEEAVLLMSKWMTLCETTLSANRSTDSGSARSRWTISTLLMCARLFRAFVMSWAPMQTKAPAFARTRVVSKPIPE